MDIPPGPGRPEREQLTYAQLDARSDAFAAAVDEGEPDRIVAILLPRDSSDLYAAQLGVLKAGAAFACMDPTFPDAHLADVLADAGVVALITNGVGHARCAATGANLPRLIDTERLAPARSSWAAPRPSETDLAYVIYTSGTTGKPKGVLIEHRSVVNLVAGDLHYFGLTADDRVAQCSSPAYDSSIEETWLAFAAGAALVLLDDHTLRLGPDLTPWLAHERISVLCPTPTLLRMTGCLEPKASLPDLWLLYVGGEALPRDLANRWSTGLWMENGYGPTECTVTVVRGRIRPGEPVTIGAPISGAQAHVLTDELKPVLDGETGELCISGAPLARGYHNRAELSSQRFVDHPELGRIYRTGDLVRRAENGALEHLGRIDAQVKLRGYRVELGAIEAVLVDCPEVVAAACTIQGEGSAQVLVAHIVPQTLASPPVIEELKDRLRLTLPPYMTPARFAFRAALPTTVGGKLDRSALPQIAAGARPQARRVVGPSNANERRILAAFRRELGHTEDISVHDDFFTDLGGDSLAAVGVVADLRDTGAPQEEPGLGITITVSDLYEWRTAARLVAHVSPDREVSAPRKIAMRPKSGPIASTLVQASWIGLEWVVGSAVFWSLARPSLSMLRTSAGLWPAAILASATAVLGVLAYLPVSLAIAVILKKLLIGRYRPMSTPAWGNFFTRHWIVCSASRLIPWAMLEGTPLASVALRALGAKVGKRVHVHRGVNFTTGGWDLLTIGDDVTLAQDAAIRLTDYEDGQLIVGAVTIGDGATVDVRAGLGPNATIEAGGYLAALSNLASGETVQTHEKWDGVPASAVGAAPGLVGVTRGRAMDPLAYGALALAANMLGLLAFAVSPLLLLLAEGMALSKGTAHLLAWLEAPRLTVMGLADLCAASALALAISLALMAATVRLMGKSRPGVVHQFSLEALQIWTKTRLVFSAGRWLSGSMAWPWWLRAAGMRLGPGCEISTIIDVLPETVSIGAESFFADGIYFCAPHRHRGTITVANTRLGTGTFLGNHALIPAGHDWPDGLFLGVSTVADPQLAVAAPAWFGHPPLELPQREVVASDRRLTHDPGPLRFATRLFWEALRFTLPSVPLLLSCAWYEAMRLASSQVGLFTQAVVIAPLLTAIDAVSVCLLIVALKWLLLGRMKPGQHAFWSCWCGRWDFVFMAWSLLASPWLAGLEGSLMLNGFLRLTGVKIGKRVLLGRGFSQVVDPDMLSFGDEATASCNIQAHSFEDRILKLDHIEFGRASSVGDKALVFYGATIGEGTLVEPHSVVMKRDHLKPYGRYSGCPVRPV